MCGACEQPFFKKKEGKHGFARLSNFINDHFGYGMEKNYIQNQTDLGWLTVSYGEHNVTYGPLATVARGKLLKWKWVNRPRVRTAARDRRFYALNRHHPLRLPEIQYCTSFSKCRDVSSASLRCIVHFNPVCLIKIEARRGHMMRRRHIPSGCLTVRTLIPYKIENRKKTAP